MFKTVLLLIAYLLFLIGIFMLYKGVVILLSTMLGIKSPSIFFNKSEEKPLDNGFQLYQKYGNLYEEFSIFVCDMLRNSCRDIGVKSPNSEQELYPPIERRICLKNNQPVFNYIIRREEQLYEGGGRKVQKTYPKSEQVSQSIHTVLSNFIASGYSYKAVKTLSGTDVVHIKIYGVEWGLF